jgi:hypothetical protein
MMQFDRIKIEPLKPCRLEWRRRGVVGRKYSRCPRRWELFQLGKPKWSGGVPGAWGHDVRKREELYTELKARMPMYIV